MKNNLIIILTIIIFLLSFRLINNFGKNIFEESNKESGFELESLSNNSNLNEINNNTYEIFLNEDKINFSIFKEKDISKIHLFPNFSDKLTSEEIMMEKQCKSLISAGFYTNENKPIGLFVYEGRKIKNLIANNLFNGIFSININNEAKITNEIKYENLRVGLQSGPIIMKDGESIALNVKNDKKSRRIVVAISDLKEIIFFVFYNKESVFTGPYLKDLPYALKLSEEKIGIKISDAINLDGGTASSFYTEYLNLSELTPIGSYFCLD